MQSNPLTQLAFVISFLEPFPAGGEGATMSAAAAIVARSAHF
jgi:hypothetical protein